VFGLIPHCPDPRTTSNSRELLLDEIEHMTWKEWKEWRGLRLLMSSVLPTWNSPACAAGANDGNHLTRSAGSVRRWRWQQDMTGVGCYGAASGIVSEFLMSFCLLHTFQRGAVEKRLARLGLCSNIWQTTGGRGCPLAIMAKFLKEEWSTNEKSEQRALTDPCRSFH